MRVGVLKVGRTVGAALRQALINLAWDANPAGDNVTDYELSFGTASGTYNGVDSPRSVGNVTTYTFRTTQTGVTLYFALKARNAAGLSASFSNEVSVTT